VAWNFDIKVPQVVLAGAFDANHGMFLVGHVADCRVEEFADESKRKSNSRGVRAIYEIDYLPKTARTTFTPSRESIFAINTDAEPELIVGGKIKVACPL